MCATHGLPAMLVSDNGPPFTSSEFEKFVKANGIIRRCISSYHPSLNGLAENMVHTVKQVLSKCKISANATIETHIARFLASCCNTCHQLPQELLLNYSFAEHLKLAYHLFTLVHHNELKKLSRTK